MAELDSGIDLDNSDVARFSAKVNFTTDTTVDDLYGHGTHVAGAIGGSGKYSSSTTTGFSVQYKGIAPECKFLNLEVLNSEGFGYTSDVIAALNWCLANQGRYKIRVINMSLGHPVYESYKTDPLCRVVESCIRAGMVVVASAGNYGKTSDGTPI